MRPLRASHRSVTAIASLSLLVPACHLLTSVDRTKLDGATSAVTGSGGTGGATSSAGGTGGSTSSAGGTGGSTSSAGGASPLPVGHACNAREACGTGFCVDGVCCDSACGGVCSACAKANGAVVDGICRENAVKNAQDAGTCDDQFGDCGGQCICDAGGTCSTWVPVPAELTAGSEHSCARYDNGAVKCWGYNDYGQLGLEDASTRADEANEMGDALPFVQLGKGARAARLVAGAQHTCALLDDGSVKCWGDNADGALGLGDSANRGDEPGEMGDNLPAVKLGTGKKAVALARGAFHGCAVLDDGTVKCWGANGVGQLGLGDDLSRGDNPNEMGDKLPAVDLGTGKKVVSVACGTFHSCARLTDGSVKCWGLNSDGQLGLGDTASRGDAPNQMGNALAAVSLGAGKKVVDLAAGNAFTCALLDDGAVKCWGYNGSGQLGLGDTAPRGDEHADGMGGQDELGEKLPAVDLGAGKKATALAVGANHACARLNDQTLKCWGLNESGQLGIGTTLNRGDEPGEMGDALSAALLGSGAIVTSVATATPGDHTCARLEGGTVKCWGANLRGQLGIGSINPQGYSLATSGDNMLAVKLSGM
jgi:alpha-tubulin suppressor-like RCC1 family protein